MLQNPDYGDLPPEYRQLLKRNVLERLIRDVLIEQYVADEGFRIGDNVVTDMIQSADTISGQTAFFRKNFITPGWTRLRRTCVYLKPSNARAFVSASCSVASVQRRLLHHQNIVAT